MLIAQITDLHLGFDPGDPEELNRRRLDSTLRTLAAMVPAPDLLLATGDLADKGNDRISYARLREAVAGLPFPVHFALGNHDSRDSFRAAFPEAPMPGGFHQYAVEAGDLRILVLDTLGEGRHGGAWCEARAEWLRARLAEAPGRPTLLALHHPPIESGHGWMTEDPEAGWVKRLESVVAARSDIVGLVAGHLHRAIVARWAGTLLAICPSTAPQVALDFRPLDPERPDGRAMIVAEPPGFAIHHWDGHRLATHFATAAEPEILACFDASLQPLLRHLAEERRGR
jgi:3',5'-cyclic AMP phosphodiesterase CpdA